MDLPLYYLPLSYVIGFLPFLLTNLGLVKLLIWLRVCPWKGAALLFFLNEYILWDWWYLISTVLAAGYDRLEKVLVNLL